MAAPAPLEPEVAPEARDDALAAMDRTRGLAMEV